MSAAIIAAAKKLIMMFFTDKKFRKFVVGIIALAILESTSATVRSSKRWVRSTAL